MPLKDYYRILEASPSASLQEIKISYRRLALKYHPDKNPGNPYAAQHFREIKEAYDVLSNPRKRHLYNFDHQFEPGIVRKKNVRPDSPESILMISQQMRTYIEKLDIFRMDHEALQFQLLDLLSTSRMAMLTGSENESIRSGVIHNVLAILSIMKFSLSPPVLEKLLFLSNDSPSLENKIKQFQKSNSKSVKLKQLTPFIVLLATAILLVLIYLLASH
ncbi:MAG TPA: DnaJ domain-containing protein [Flavitalea sp.]|nr:DnaJ domain-containing protein [Flavitalea sp.]